MKKLFCCLSVMLLISGCGMFGTGSDRSQMSAGTYNENNTNNDNQDQDQDEAECTVNADCTGGKICDTETNVCVCPSNKPILHAGICMNVAATTDTIQHAAFDFQAVIIDVTPTLAAIGQACSPNVACAQGLACFNGICVQIVGFNQSCSAIRICSPGLSCASWAGACKKLPGMICNDRYDCANNHFSTCHKNGVIPHGNKVCH